MAQLHHDHASHDHGDHDHHAGHDHDHAPVSACGPAACGGGACATASAPVAALATGGLVLRIPAMDCPTEEGRFVRRWSAFPEVMRLQFDLAGRALRVDAPPSSWESVTAAINAAGFKTETLSAPPAAADTARSQRTELIRLIAALAVAVGAELVHFLAPDTLPWRGLGMVVAAVAIALSGCQCSAKACPRCFGASSTSTP